MDTASPSKVRVAIIDDHPIVCDGLTAIINRESDFEVCGTAARHHEILPLIDRHRPQVVLLDISLQDCDGLDMLRTIKSQHPGVAVAILSVHDEQVFAARAIRSGASGYIMKGADATSIVQALRDIVAGGFVFSRRVQQMLFWEQTNGPGGSDPLLALTDRELSVFRLLGQGMNTAQIAGTLKISSKTVETHRVHVKTKLQIESFTKLIELAVSWHRTQTAGHAKETNG